MPQRLKNKLKPLEDVEPINKAIAKVRKKRGLTQAELAEKVGITRVLVSAYESGRVRLFDEMIIRFAKALKVSTDELLGMSNQSNEKCPSLRFMRRIKELESLPEIKKKRILSNLDDLIKANKST